MTFFQLCFTLIEVVVGCIMLKIRTQGLGLIGAAFGLGFIIGPIIAFTTLALSGNNYQLVAFIAGGLRCLFCWRGFFNNLPLRGYNNCWRSSV